MRIIVPLAAAALLAGCPSEGAAGDACNDANPCPDSYACVVNTCTVTAGAPACEGDEDCAAGAQCFDAFCFATTTTDPERDDAGPSRVDAGERDDDAGNAAADAGSVADAGPSVDAGASAGDAGFIVDAGSVDGGTVDAGALDAGPTDAGAQDGGGGATAFAEAFDGDGGPWDATRWDVDEPDSLTTSGAGTMTVDDQNIATAGAIAIFSPIADASLTLSFRFGDTQANARLRLFLRASGDWGGMSRPDSGYMLELRNDDGSARLQEVTGGNGNDIDTGLSWAQTPDTATHRLRFEVVGSTIRWRVWNDGATEPSTWESEVTDTAVTGTGTMQLRASTFNGGTHDVFVDDLVVTAP